MPDKHEVERLMRSLAVFKNHFLSSPDSAQKLIDVGESSPDKRLASEELAAWTMLASSVMNLAETVIQD
jgi:hypothetical protein